MPIVESVDVIRISRGEIYFKLPIALLHEDGEIYSDEQPWPLPSPLALLAKIAIVLADPFIGACLVQEAAVTFGGKLWQ